MAAETTRQEAAILEARGVTLRFGGLEALNDLSFSIAPRQIVSVIGPNGAGKTTLLNAITGVYVPDGGEILFQGRALSGLKPFQIAALGIHRTFQQIQLFANMTVLENVMVGMHCRTTSGFLRGIFHPPSERAEEKRMHGRAKGLLDFVGLLPKAEASAAHLPIVEQRRLEIVRALAGEPQLLLLDEPAAGLNIRETEAMGELILRLKQEGRTLILVEHNIHLVMSISDRLIDLHHGSKIGEGRPEEIQRDRQVLQAYLGM